MATIMMYSGIVVLSTCSLYKRSINHSLSIHTALHHESTEEQALFTYFVLE